MLNLTLEHLYHDVSTPPGRARIALVAELVQWRTRSLIARRSFEQSAPTERETAEAAFEATGRALAALLDELSAWVETEAQAQAPAPEQAPAAAPAPLPAPAPKPTN